MKHKELEAFKVSYESQRAEIDATSEHIKTYMNEVQRTVYHKIQVSDEKIAEYNERLSKAEGDIMEHKFDIDRNKSILNTHEESIRKC